LPAGATALGFAGGAALLLRFFRTQAARFNRAKGLTAVAAGLGFLVCFWGFIVIGGEWF
jgi:predicted small integral membrane protein